MATTKTIKRKGDDPETVRQAIVWQNVKNHYVTLGLCSACSGQAAYGHQLGFARVNDPCGVCRAVVLPAKWTDRHGMRPQRWLRGHYRKTATAAD